MKNIDKNISFCTDARKRADHNSEDSYDGLCAGLKTIIIDDEYLVCVGDDYANASQTIRRF